MSEYIRKEDAIDVLDDFQVGIENGEGNYSWAKFKMNELEPADVVSKADLKTLLEETEKELVKDTDKYSIAYNFIVAVIGIIKCKIMQIGERKE